MAQPFPYSYYACDCYDANNTSSSKRASQLLDESEDEHNFDPRNPRSNYALYPLEHLLYCEDCRQMRCPRCVIEETLNWYCPSCLFEVPSSVVKSDGNRCTRNCYNCPVCMAPMTTNSLDTQGDNGPPYILACPYCHWSTVEIGIEFEKSTGISAQLARIANGGKHMPTQKERDKERERKKEAIGGEREQEQDSPTHDDLFSNLNAFYKAQIEAQTPSNPFSQHDINFSSPSAYSRIMNLYSVTGSKKNKRNKPAAMREAASSLEGLTIHDPKSDAGAIERIKKEGWNATLSTEQRLAQINPNLRFFDELRPVATLLCTKRSKRCRSCRQILSKPESKITSTRYKIKLLALNHIPRLSIRALNATPPSPLAPRPTEVFDYNALKPGIPTHFLLHLSNPLFDPIRVTLATPSTTTGKIKSRVTILCPQFEVGANTDVWDDALSSSLSPVKRSSGAPNDPTQPPQIEAGKIWDRGRNWTSVAVEIVPGLLDEAKSGTDQEELDDDEDVLEIPIFVRIEFESEVNVDDRGLNLVKEGKAEREKREEAFWAVLGVGRIR